MIIFKVFAALSLVASALRSKQELLSSVANNKTTSVPLPKIGALQEAESMKLMVLSISMPKGYKKVMKFYKSIGLDEVGAISPGVQRSKLNLKNLIAEGRVDPDYETTGETDHPIIPELATTYAHHRAIKSFLRSEQEYALIFEEDAKMVDNGRFLLANIPGGEKGHFVKALKTIVQKAPKDWMEINLGRCDAQCHMQKQAAKLSDKVFMFESKYAYCSSGYLLSRRGAEFLNQTYYGKLRYSNDLTKVTLYEKGLYKQYAVSPRLIEQKTECGVNGCGNVPECGPTGKLMQRNCEMKPLCEMSAKCRTVDVGSPKIPNDFVFATYPPEKLAALDGIRAELKKKHLRIRSPRMFLDGCGFFTFPLIVMSQLQLAKKFDLIGSKPPVVYMPERTHYHECNKKNKDHVESPEFWEKWFDPISTANWRNVSEKDVWELSQASILTAYYDPHSVQGYPYDDEATADNAWIINERAKAKPVMKAYIKPKRPFMEEALSFYRTYLGSSKQPVLGLHMRGTDKFVHPKVDPERYVLRAKNFVEKNKGGKLFLATDDTSYFNMMKNTFNSSVISRPTLRTKKNILYDDKVDKNAKCKQVLMDSLVLALTSEMVKCWSGVSEFSIYVRESHIHDRPKFTQVVDLEATDTVNLVAIRDDPFIEGPSPKNASWAIFVPTMPSREEHVTTMLDGIGLSKYSSLIGATTPKTLTAAIHPNATLNIKEASCMWSHHQSYEAFLASGKQYGLIFEDDFMPTLASDTIETGLPHLIDSFIKERESGRANWDILNLARCYDCCNERCQTVVSTLEKEKVSLITSPHPYCGSAYLISRKGGKVLSRSSDPITRETDDNMLYVSITGELNYMSVTPRIFSQDRKNFGSKLHDEPEDLECIECSSEECFDKEYMPKGFEHVSAYKEGAIKDQVVRVTQFNHHLPNSLTPKKAISEDQFNLAASELDHLTSPDCESVLGRSMTPTLVEWGFGSTVNSVVKPYMHALSYGYCIKNPTGFIKYNCSNWETLFQPVSKPLANEDTCQMEHLALEDPTKCATAFCGKKKYSAIGQPEFFFSSEYHECCAKYSFDKHGGKMLPKTHVDIGFFGSVSLILHHALRPSKTLQSKINEAKENMKWPKAGTPMIGMHYRAGDACLEEEVTLGRKCDTFETYMSHVHLVAGKYGIKHIFLATDSAAAIKSLPKYKNYPFHYNKVAGRGGKRNQKAVDDLLFHKEIDGCKEAEDTMIDMHLLGATDAFIGKFSSNIDRVAYNLIFARTRAYQPYVSLDNTWCFDYGIKSRPDGVRNTNQELYYC
mmetsp:Transcript_42048/g.68288  ORF Transcript_42048/g.68288 Transcript_42048/m.68288 type:complete len:1292 (-) Transcript_42048:158-4033(-)